jgi:hypothetical protein
MPVGLSAHGLILTALRCLGYTHLLRLISAFAAALQEVMWFNMREEPMVYINGLPFVLREQQRPMKNLQEYAGIDAERLERMEARLKQDVLGEAGALLSVMVCIACMHGPAYTAVAALLKQAMRRMVLLAVICRACMHASYASPCCNALAEVVSAMKTHCRCHLKCVDRLLIHLLLARRVCCSSPQRPHPSGT